MKLVFMTPAAGILAIILTSCGTSKNNGGGPLASTGPFDKNGNYREDWADDPSKWRKTGGAPSPHEMRTDEIPYIAKNDEPPANSNPLPPAQTRSTTPVLAQRKPSSDSPSHTSRKSSSTAANSTPKPTVRKATPKPVLVKAKPKPKPAPKKTRYLVKKGDSLSAIASRTGSSVSALRRENSISGTLIHPGQSLVIPKR